MRMMRLHRQSTLSTRILAVVVVAALALTLVCGRVCDVRGDLTSDLASAQQRMERLRSQLEEIQRLIKENKTAKYSLLTQLSSLNGQIDEMENELQQLDASIRQLEMLLSKTGAQIATKEKLYEELTADTASAVDLLYHVSNLDMSGLPFAGGDLGSAIDAQIGVSAVLNQIALTLSAVTTQKLSLETDRTEYAATKAQLQEIHSLKIEQTALLAQQRTAKEQAVSYLSSKGSKYSADEGRIQAEMDREEELISEIIRKINEQLYPGGDPTGNLSWPLRGHINVTDVYGYRTHPITRQWRLHAGLDMGCANGTAVIAPADGTVVYVGTMAGYGKMLMIQHGQHMTTVYGHLKSWVAKNGELVTRGQVVALSDNTGWSTGPHLHFEVRIDGIAKDPMKYLAPKP
jgi:murein DD-endopeptidase MepM/ murein hydrolase activator NlpD